MKKQTAYIIFAFFLYAFLYSFLLVGDSYYNLEGDLCGIGSWLYRDVCRENFINDPYILKDKNFYLIPHLAMLKAFFIISGSYVSSLKMLLFFQIFFTLWATFYALRKFFPDNPIYTIAFLSFFFSLVYIKIPQVENVGFYGLRSASARSSFGVFIPLIALFYYKGIDLTLGKFKIPNIICVCGITGILGNLHPQTGIMLFAVLFIHYCIFNRAKLKSEMWTLTAAAVVGGIAFFIFISVFLKQLYNTNAFSYIYGIIGGISLNAEIKHFNRQFFNFESLWLTQATYLPYVFIFIIMLFFKLDDEKDEKHRELYAFFKNAFIISFIIHIILGGLGYHFILFSKFSFAQIFMRGSRVAFFFMEMLASYFILRGFVFVKSKTLRFSGIAGILFFLFFQSGSRLEFHSNWLAAISVFKNFTLLQETLFFRALSIGALFIFIILSKKKILEMKYLLAYCVFMLFLWPVMCDGLRMKTGEIIDQFSGVGSWKLIAKFTSSTCAEDTEQFNELVKWTSGNTRKDDVFFYLLPDTYGHKFKIATIRSGFGDVLENGARSCNSKARIAGIRATKELLSEKTKRTKKMDKLIDDYNVTYIVADKREFENCLGKLKKYKPAFSNDNYIVFSVKK